MMDRRRHFRPAAAIAAICRPGASTVGRPDSCANDEHAGECEADGVCVYCILSRDNTKLYPLQAHTIYLSAYFSALAAALASELKEDEYDHHSTTRSKSPQHSTMRR